MDLFTLANMEKRLELEHIMFIYMYVRDPNHNPEQYLMKISMKRTSLMLQTLFIKLYSF